MLIFEFRGLVLCEIAQGFSVTGRPFCTVQLRLIFWVFCVTGPRRWRLRFRVEDSVSVLFYWGLSCSGAGLQEQEPVTVRGRCVLFSTAVLLWRHLSTIPISISSSCFIPRFLSLSYLLAQIRLPIGLCSAQPTTRSLTTPRIIP